MESMSRFLLILALILPNVGGWVGTIAVSDNFDTWYKPLNKPTWTPPSYAFGPIWTVLYTSMGYASYLVWRDGEGFRGRAFLALSLYIIQLALNWAWTPIFFGYHSPKWGLVDIGLLDLFAVGCAVGFGHINTIAGLLMVPYLIWLGIATALNYYILTHNNF